MHRETMRQPLFCFMVAYHFANEQQMLNSIQHCDLYCAEKELYVFLYNIAGAVCVYRITEAKANELSKKALEAGESWSAFLGPGGQIYDDPMVFCREEFSGCWIDTDEWIKDQISDTAIIDLPPLVKKDAEPGEWCTPNVSPWLDAGDGKKIEIGIYREPDTGEYTFQVFHGDTVVYTHQVNL